MQHDEYRDRRAATRASFGVHRAADRTRPRTPFERLAAVPWALMCVLSIMMVSSSAPSERSV
jgi:hypothetical protein